MITLLDTIGPAIGRASWQAAVLALLVVLVLRFLGERLAPRWRFLLWSVVVARLLFVATPGSPWSVFNVVPWKPEASARPLTQREDETRAAPSRSPSPAHLDGSTGELPRPGDPNPEPALSQERACPETPAISSEAPVEATVSIEGLFHGIAITRILSLIWLAGFLALGLKLLRAAFVLRMRLSACRPVRDAALLDLLDSFRRRAGLKRAPALLVTPECLGPCTVGTWNPRIILPESLVTQSSTKQMRHVLAHELAHLVRGDLWTNWLMLMARTLHWFNPVAWWTVREMQAEREAACDDLAFAVLEEEDRFGYASTIVELAASLGPSAIAPGFIGLFSSPDRLKARIQRLLRSSSVPMLRTPVAAGLLLGLALLGLTDATPGSKAQSPKDTGPTVLLQPGSSETPGKTKALPVDADGTQPANCRVIGTVTDRVTGKPAVGAVITARRVDQWGEVKATSDADGGFRLMVPEGRYDFLAEAEERVCIAVTGRECLAGEKVELPKFHLIAGGFIAGQVINTATGQTVSVSDSGEPIMLGFYGPSQPARRVISPLRLAAVDRTGRFLLRAAPGKNYPYFVNTRGVRMAWNTREQPAVVVKEGETTTYNMLITPELPPEEKLKAARKLVEGLSKQPKDRTAQILFEFRKLNHTVDETELWCLLMRELVAIGRDAVPQLCAELDRTTENRMLRRLGFALRAIGDPRAVPALIRAIPRTLLPGSSDYGLLVSDKELTDFMQTHDLTGRKGAMYFDLGRPVREIFGALHQLTGQDLDDAELFGLSLSEDPRRQILQRRIFLRLARRWQEWWEKNAQRFTDDTAYHKVNLMVADEPLPPASQKLGKTARVSDVSIGEVLSPAIQGGQHAWHFLDLDTGYQRKWPTHIPRVEPIRDTKQLEKWASQTGVDLMCITHRSADGKETYVLRALGMSVREISPRDLRNLDRLITAGKLPEGRPVGELLMHFDTISQQLVPDANAAFLYVTREGNMGVIEVTDRVTRTADITGMPGAPPGVGFHKGVRFNLKVIIP